MSLIKNSGSKPQSCGDMHHIEKMIRDSIGGIVDFQVVGTDTSLSGVKTGASITALTGDYAPGSGVTGEKNPDGTFTGRNDWYKPVIVRGGGLGQAVNVEVRKATYYDLRGIIQ